jgi:hypothetical protein
MPSNQKSVQSVMNGSANTLAYYSMATIMAVENDIVKVPGACIIKLDL